MRKLLVIMLLFIPLAVNSRDRNKLPDYRYLVQGEWVIEKNYDEIEPESKPINISEDDVIKEFSYFNGDTIIIGDTKITIRKGTKVKEYELFYCFGRIAFIEKKDIYVTKWFKIEKLTPENLLLSSLGRRILLKRISKPSLSSDSFHKIKVEIEQDGNIYPIKDNRVKIKKKIFSINLKMKKPMGVMINASVNDRVFKMALTGKNLNGKAPFSPASAMAEYVFNSSREIKLSKTGNNYWYYSSFNQHSFSEVNIDKHTFYAKRKIEQFNFVDDKLIIPLEKVKQKVLYLVFFNFDNSGKYNLINIQPLSIEFE